MFEGAGCLTRVVVVVTLRFYSQSTGSAEPWGKGERERETVYAIYPTSFPLGCIVLIYTFYE